MKRGTIEHPKTLMLAEVLSIPRYAAVGILESLWHWTAKYARSGDIGRYSDSMIASGVGWTDDAQKLITALRECGWINESDEYRLVIHDWHDHADDAVRKQLERTGERFCDGTKPRKKQPQKHVEPRRDKVETTSRHCRDKVEPALPCLSHALPSHALPSHHHHPGVPPVGGRMAADDRDSAFTGDYRQAFDEVFAMAAAHLNSEPLRTKRLRKLQDGTVRQPRVGQAFLGVLSIASPENRSQAMGHLADLVLRTADAKPSNPVPYIEECCKDLIRKANGRAS